MTKPIIVLDTKDGSYLTNIRKVIASEVSKIGSNMLANISRPISALPNPEAARDTVPSSNKRQRYISTREIDIGMDTSPRERAGLSVFMVRLGIRLPEYRIVYIKRKMKAMGRDVEYRHTAETILSVMTEAGFVEVGIVWRMFAETILVGFTLVEDSRA